MRKPAQNAAAALLVAILGEQDGYRLERGALRRRLDLSPYDFGQALARARYAGAIRIVDGVVELTSTGSAAAEAGKRGLSREERRRLEQAAR